VCRKVARRVVKEGKESPIAIDAKSIPKLLGPPKFTLGRAEANDEIGLVSGLAVTSVGGDLLPSEATVFPGKGKLTVTGLVEKGMEESGQAALSYVRSRLVRFGLPEDALSKVDVHVHFPDFVKKDGPSAGVTMVTAVVSALLKAPVRRDVAMTGEITLRGRVMGIGGLKEKLLAAHRGQIRTVILPKENRKDLREVPRRVLTSLRLVLVDHIDDVLREALLVDDPARLFGDPGDVVIYDRGELTRDARPPAPPHPPAPPADWSDAGDGERPPVM
jgi:ATP-dependent Lon protease